MAKRPLSSSNERIRDPLGRAIQVVRHLAEHPSESQGVRDIARSLGMQPSTVSRLLTSLSRERLVQLNAETGGYSPHIDLIRLGLLTSRKLNIRSIARPHLQSIADACNESVFLGVYDPAEHQMLRVESIQSSRPLRYVVELDKWTEIYRGASGLAILAFLPPDEQEEVLKLSDAQASDDAPWLRREELGEMLAKIQAQGYACTRGRRVEGAVGIAAPVFGSSGHVVGDVILTIPEIRFQDDSETAMASQIMVAARRITEELGGHMPLST